MLVTGPLKVLTCIQKHSLIHVDTKLNYDHYTSSIHIIENLDFIEEKTDFHAKTVELHENAHSGPHGPLLARFP